MSKAVHIIGTSIVAGLIVFFVLYFFAPALFPAEYSSGDVVKRCVLR
jgi:hypothetical protein